MVNHTRIEQIKSLRTEGKTYPEIAQIVGCAISVVCYHCGEGQKEKHALRQRLNSKRYNHIMKRKKDNFMCVKGDRKGPDKRARSSCSSKEFQAHLEKHPFCYLTGRPIDLMAPSTWHCDHIVPVSKGGDNSLDNLGLTCKEANLAKANLSLEDFLSLCIEVLKHHGYDVNKVAVS